MIDMLGPGWHPITVGINDGSRHESIVLAEYRTHWQLGLDFNLPAKQREFHRECARACLRWTRAETI